MKHTYMSYLLLYPVLVLGAYAETNIFDLASELDALDKSSKVEVSDDIYAPVLKGLTDVQQDIYNQSIEAAKSYDCKAPTVNLSGGTCTTFDFTAKTLACSYRQVVGSDNSDAIMKLNKTLKESVIIVERWMSSQKDLAARCGVGELGKIRKKKNEEIAERKMLQAQIASIRAKENAKRAEVAKQKAAEKSAKSGKNNCSRELGGSCTGDAWGR